MTIFDRVKLLFNILLFLVLTVFSTQNLSENELFSLTEKSYSSVEDINNAGGGLAKAWKSGWSKQKVLDLPKGNRPKPSTYLDKKYIDQHLAKFDDGASYLVPKDALDRFGRNPVGRSDGQFVMSKNEMDDLFNKANGDLSIIEKELGIPSGLWKDKELVRIDIPNPKESNIRIPDGNEGGANELWLPGGKLPNGYSEGVLDAISEGQYIETVTKLK